MTKKHFIELAAIMKSNKANISYNAFIHMCNKMADWCSSNNKLFDRNEFLKACGVE